MTMQPLQLIVINNDNEDEEQDEEKNEKEEDEDEGDDLKEDVKVEPNMGKLIDKIMNRMSNINVKRREIICNLGDGPFMQSVWNNRGFLKQLMKHKKKNHLGTGFDCKECTNNFSSYEKIHSNYRNLSAAQFPIFSLKMVG